MVVTKSIVSAPFRGRVSTSTVLFLALVALYGLLVVPVSTYLSYLNEFSSGHLSILISLFVAACITFTILVISVVILPLSLHNLALRLLLLGVVLGWYNYNCLDYNGKIIGVDPDVFVNSYSRAERLFFIGLGLLFIFNKKINNFLVTGMMIICLVGLMNLVSINKERAERVEGSTNFSPKLFSYSSDMNVLHIVLDGMQSSLFSELIAAEPNQKKAFDGFYLFPDTLASTDITYLSTASFLSGEAFEGNEPISSYRLRKGLGAREGATPPPLPPLHEELKKNKFELDVLTGCQDCLQRRSEYRTFIYHDFSGIPSLKRDLLRILDFTLLRMLPWRLKPKLYRGGMPFFSTRGQGDDGRANQALNFLREYGSKVSRSSAERSYKLIHLLAPHGPWTTGPNCEPRAAELSQEAIRFQGACVAKSLGPFLESLKKANVYDNTLIIIHGDHGICVPEGLPSLDNSPVPECVGNVNPLLLVKPLGRRGALEISSRPAALIDLPKTILDQLGVPTSLPNRSLFSDESSEERTRYFFAFKPDRVTAYSNDRFDSTERYTIKGSLFDASSWRK